MLLLTLAATPGALLSHAPLNLVDRRGGLSFAALAIAALLFFVVLGSAMRA